ncbi:hypothetical protein scyTo_0009422 [Scyliorhinus torazame]|uniref:Uncharacterized protein n=1 Tax=Scyliorhinus torazame TaxID=75743 RepID=A0A401NM22_SCYTO|nr:hypothetical protein [Scyliorhinus torazame]
MCRQLITSEAPPPEDVVLWTRMRKAQVYAFQPILIRHYSRTSDRNLTFKSPSDSEQMKTSGVFEDKEKHTDSSQLAKKIP